MKILSLLILIIFPIFLSGQKTIPTIGGGLGLGNMFGNFPSQSTLGTKLYLETHSPISFFDRIQYHFSFAQKVEKFLPGSYGYNHYSYFTSFGIGGMFNQQLNNNYFIEEGLGIIYLNDRSFNDIDTWNFGMLINLVAGIDLKNDFELTFNIDYGITINKTNVSYVLIFLGVNYNL
jgi:hypothetical protein